MSTANTVSCFTGYLITLALFLEIVSIGAPKSLSDMSGERVEVRSPKECRSPLTYGENVQEYA